MTLDPNGTLQYVTAPQGDRLAQARNAYYAGQELFAFKQIRWWWNNTHQAVYDAGDGAGTVPHGPHTQWVPQSKSVGFLEYGFPTSDRCSNEENVFYDPASISGGTPFWSIWNAAKTAPLIDPTLALTALQAFWQYWTTPGNNETSSAGVPMIADDLMFAWCWDARPLPEFPLRTDIWSDGADWANGHWLNGKLPSLPPQAPSSAPSFGPFASFPTLIGQGWSSKVTPRFATLEHGRASGKSARRMKMRWPLYEIELTYDFFARRRGDARTAKHPRLLREHAGTGATLLARAAWALRADEPNDWNRRRRDDGVSNAARDRGIHGAARGRIEPDGGAHKRRGAGLWRVESLVRLRAQPHARERSGDGRERQCGRLGVMALSVQGRRARLRAIRRQPVSLKEREAGDGETVRPRFPSPAGGRRWPHVVGSDEGCRDLVETSRGSSSDPC